MNRRLLALLLVPLVLACGKVGPGNFDRYARNEAGVKELARYVADASHPMEARVQAGVVVAEGGWPDKIMKLLDGAPDPAEYAPRLAKALADRLPSAGTPEKVGYLRESLFTTFILVPPERRAEAQKVVAAWAFEGLSLDSPADAVKVQVEQRMQGQLHQIAELGAAGTDGAVTLVRHGFGVDRMADYVLSVPDPAAHRKLLEAYRRLHRTPDLVIPFTHLERIGKVRDAAAAEYLLDLAADTAQEDDLRAAAFNEAAGLMEDAAVMAAGPDGVLSRLRKLLASADPDDRWSAAHFLLLVRGFAATGEVLAGLKDDGVYLRAREDPMKTMIDFCRTAVFKRGKDEEPWAFVKRLLSSPGNRVHQALGTICVKVSEDPTRAGLLAGLVGSGASLETVLGEKLTLGTLARNARDGLAMFAEVARDRADGRMTEAEAKLKRFAILVDLLDTGDTYRKAVAERYEADRKDAEAKR